METRTHAPAKAGNGAREALVTYLTHQLPLLAPAARTDHLLAWLWAEGFKVVRIDESDDEQ